MIKKICKNNLLKLLHILGKVTVFISSSGTKGYTVSVSEQANGPWTEVKSGTFTDPRQHGGPNNHPQTSETFLFTPVVAQYVKFSCTSYFGAGCVLQYIGVFGVSGTVKIKQD